MRIVNLLMVLVFGALVVACSGGSSDGSVTETAPIAENSNELYGVWSGVMESEFNGSTKQITMVALGSDLYLVDYYGKTAVGSLEQVESGYTSKMDLYQHYPVDLAQKYKTPALGQLISDDIEITLTVIEGDITGRFKIKKEDQTQDQGVISLIKTELATEMPTVLSATYEHEKFVCGNEEPGILWCFSRLSASVDAGGNVTGSYDDNFAYQSRPDGIIGSVPSVQEFTGKMHSIDAMEGLYRYELTLAPQGTYGPTIVSGVGWNDHFIAISPSNHPLVRWGGDVFRM